MQTLSTEPDETVLAKEAERLHAKLSKTGFRMEDCAIIAPLTYEINRLKKAKNAVILAHHYMTPDIVYGIADHAEDASGLVRRAEETDADMIVMCSVLSLAEAVKIARPDKIVLCPDLTAGCSVAESINLDQVMELKRQNPGIPTVAYVNTTGDVKAAADYLVTSANVRQVVANIPEKKIIFFPDHALARSLEEELGKEVISWDGKCVVHDNYTLEQVVQFRQLHPDTHVLFHSEVDPSLYAHGEMHGGTRAMKEYVARHPEVDSFFLVTECGLSDQLRVEYPEKKFIGTCALCPFMKRIDLENTLKALKEEAPALDFLPEIMANARTAYLRTKLLLAKTAAKEVGRTVQRHRECGSVPFPVGAESDYAKADGQIGI